MKNKAIISIIVIVLAMALIAYMVCGYYKKETFKYKNPIVSMEIEDYGIIKIELYPDMAPNTVSNFIKLCKEGYYNGLTFHRVEESLIQGGDIAGDGSGKTEKNIKGEFAANDYKSNTLKFERGTIGMARQDFTMYYYYTGDSSLIEKGYNTAYAQFFIMAQDEENYNGTYAGFGKVIEGMEIVDKLTVLETTTETDEETGETKKTTTPVNAPTIKNVSVETYGIDYEEPKFQDAFNLSEYLS